MTARKLRLVVGGGLLFTQAQNVLKTKPSF